MKKLFVFLTAIAFVCLFAMSVSAQTTTCDEHKFESAVITKAPTHTEDGILTYTCSVCHTTETKVITARHTYHSVVTTPATCTTSGVITHTCECGQDTYTETLDPVHTYVETVITAPTCSTNGLVKKECTSCGASVQETLLARHTPSNVALLYAPSCFFEGSARYDCSVCGETVMQAIEKTHKYESEITKDATCTENGTLRHTCLYCNTTHVDVLVAKHSYSITGDPTDIIYHDFTQTGIKYYKCDKCDMEEGLIANPIFTFVGYSTSVPEYTDTSKQTLVDICCGYTVNYEALEMLQRVWAANGKTFEFGFVGAYEHCLPDNTAPLDSATAEPIVTSDPSSFSVKKLKFPNKPYSTIDGRLVNIGYNDHTTYFFVCLYIYDGSKTVYISDDSCREMPLPISYSMLVNGGDHDDVTSSTIKFPNGMSYSTIEGTQPSQARLDLIANSTEVYKSEASTSDSVNDESVISSIGSLGSWAGTVPNANELLNYYLELGGEATHYHKLDIEALLNDSTEAEDSWMNSINNILRAAELMAIVGESVNIDQTAETSVQLTTSSWLWNSKRDWYLTFIDGQYYTDTDLNNLTVTVDADGNKTYSAEIVYTVIDYYTFYPYKDDQNSDQFLIWGPTKQELAQLHLDGNALDFLIESSITYSATWQEGQRPFIDDGYNKTTVTINDNNTEDTSDDVTKTIDETYSANNKILTVIATSKDNQ
ncbi:MAG: hypothetical protein J6B45_01540 [Clostridia bacterium]|nr:hypothetical protein [Clostridia bacterium]